MNYTISQSIITRCQQFAEDLYDSTKDNYASKGQTNADKVKQDATIGRIGEELTARILFKNYKDITKPDYTIYEKHNKSWAHDLSCQYFDVAVKTNDASRSIYDGYSWVFERRDRGIFTYQPKPLYIAFVTINLKNSTAELMAFVNKTYLLNNALFKDMRLDFLNKTKCAVYADDLDKKNRFQLELTS